MNEHRKMNYLKQNIKHLRRTNELTQGGLAEKLGIKRALIGSYEEGRATPKIIVLQKIATLFGNTIDELINHDLRKNFKISKDISGRGLRILPIVVGEDNREKISIVPVKAAAGYLNGFADPEYVQNLPNFDMPLPELSAEKSYRIFQIQGDSMLPIPSGAYIFCVYEEDWNFIKDGQPYIVISNEEGIVYKRLYNKIDESGQLLLKSDNEIYEKYSVDINDVSEIWKALGYLSFDLPEEGNSDIRNLSSMVMGIRKDLDVIKNNK